MTCKTYCVSLELAEKLKKAGWKKETEFWWIYNKVMDLWRIKYGLPECVKEYQESWEHYSAPLATEILEELPREVSINQYSENDSVRYQVGHNKDKMALQTYRYSNNLCDALAEMWIYLHKED